MKRKTVISDYERDLQCALHTVVSISNSSEFILCLCSDDDDDDENVDVNKIEISLKSDLVVSSFIMKTIKYSIPFLVGLTLIHLINLVGGFFFASSEQQLAQLSSSAEVIDAFRGGNSTTTTSTMKAEQLMLEQRLADVRFHFNSPRKIKKATEIETVCAL